MEVMISLSWNPLPLLLRKSKTTFRGAKIKICTQYYKSARVSLGPIARVDLGTKKQNFSPKYIRYRFPFPSLYSYLLIFQGAFTTYVAWHVLLSNEFSWKPAQSLYRDVWLLLTINMRQVEFLCTIRSLVHQYILYCIYYVHCTYTTVVTTDSSLGQKLCTMG